MRCSKPEPFVSGKVEHVAFSTDDVLHTFKRGHKIVVEVQSTWFPLVDRNPQTFVDIYGASASDFKKATERVYHAPSQASRIEVSVLR
jgi:predicted acyl esterase